MGNKTSRPDNGPVVQTSTLSRPPQERTSSNPLTSILKVQRPFDFSQTRAPKSIIGVSRIPSCSNETTISLTDKDPELPQSWNLWNENYYPTRVRPEEYEFLSTRINTNSFKARLQEEEKKAEKARIEITKHTNDIFTKRETIPKPKPSFHSFFPINWRLQSYKSHDAKYFSPEGKLPELTPDIIDVVAEASKPNPSNEVLVEIEEVQVLRKDIQTLLRLNWLNDEIVYAYMLLLVLRGRNAGCKKVYAFNTFFWPKLRDSGYNSVRRWTRKVDIFSHDFVLVPVHLGNHWCLAFIDFTKRIISYYDSLGGSTQGCCDTLLDYLRLESQDKKKQSFDDENWRLVNSYAEGIPQQQNCSDCGVFACTYAEFLTRQAKLSFSQEHMPYFRKKMIYEIVKKQILE